MECHNKLLATDAAPPAEHHVHMHEFELRIRYMDCRSWLGLLPTTFVNEIHLMLCAIDLQAGFSNAQLMSIHGGGATPAHRVSQPLS